MRRVKGARRKREKRNKPMYWLVGKPRKGSTGTALHATSRRPEKRRKLTFAKSYAQHGRLK
jgi:hypothetical protein